MIVKLMENHQSVLAPNKTILTVLLLLLFGVGLAIRLYGLTDAPLDFHSTRQLHSAVMARGMYYDTRADLPAWQRDMAIQQWKQEGVIELPAMEWLTAQTYRVLGDDPLWVARVYSIFFWMLGSLAFFFLAREVSDLDGGIAGLAYFLVLPYAAIASRAFQPDPLMTALVVFALWAMARWEKNPNWGRSLAAGLLMGAAILCKATALFFVLPAFAGLLLADQGLLKALKNRQVWLMGVLAVLPYAIYHIDGMYIAGFLRGQTSLRFFPSLWLDPTWYLRWNGILSGTVGFEWLLAALIGTLLVRQKSLRGMLLGYWVGYFIYGMTFSYHIATHDYYTLPLVPLVGLGVGSLVNTALQNVKVPRWLATTAAIAVLVFAVTIKAWDVRVTLKRTDYSNEVAAWQKIGAEIGHEKKVIGITPDYGYRLAYWGWVNITNWMSTGDFAYRELSGQTFDIEKIFNEQIKDKDYFIVTVFSELDNQPEIQKLLYDRYPLIKTSSDYLLFDLRHPKTGTP